MTGGTGLIGKSFIHRFDQHQFTVLTRSPELARKQLPESVVVINSLNNLQALDEFDAVINLAGEPIIDKRWTKAQKEIICQSRWQITQQLVNLFTSSNKPPEVFLSGSAIGIYGDQGGSEISESFPLQETNFPTQICLRWEEIARQAEPYTRVVNVRTGIVLAPNGGALAKMLLPFRCNLGGRIGDGQQYMSWIHYQDHIGAMNHLLNEKSLNGAVNLVAPEPERNRVFVKVLAAALGRVAILPAPKILLKGLLGESSCLLLDSQRVSPQKLLSSGFSFAFPSLKSALADCLENRTG